MCLADSREPQADARVTSESVSGMMMEVEGLAVRVARVADSNSAHALRSIVRAAAYR
jgi:hypothetical protein